MCDALALGAIDLVEQSLIKAVNQGGDIDARGDMLKAAMMGAVAFQKGLGACHSLAHPLSNLCGLHHGLANALCLPAVVTFNLQRGDEALAKRYAEVARILCGERDSARCAPALADLRAAIDLPASLQSAGVNEAQLEPLAEAAMEDACHTLNPVTCARADMLAMYRAAF